VRTRTNSRADLDLPGTNADIVRTQETGPEENSSIPGRLGLE
jgi:hypothetical protein